MSVLFIVVPLALVIVAVALAGYLWAVRSGQMDDLETPGLSGDPGRRIVRPPRVTPRPPGSSFRHVSDYRRNAASRRALAR